MRLESLTASNNMNVDGMFLANGQFNPPGNRAAIEESPQLTSLRSPVKPLVDPALTIETFSPVVPDTYYPAAEAGQRTELLKLLGQEDRRETLLGKPLAVIEGQQRRVSVFEYNCDEWGAFVVLPPRGKPILIRKAVGDVRRLAGPSVAYPPRFVASLLDSNDDVLGKKSVGCTWRSSWEDAIVEYRRSFGGEFLGTTRFEKWLDDWPFAGYANALLRRDEVRPYLLGLYGDLAMHQMRGTFTAYEQSLIDGPSGRSHRADYCVPAHLVAPLMIRWMLVFEEPDADVLWLARATPRRWLAPGSDGITVQRATTRWGTVDYSIVPRTDGRSRIDIKLPEGNLPSEIRVRIRRPDRSPLSHVDFNGHAVVERLPEKEYVRIREPEDRQLVLEVW